MAYGQNAPSCDLLSSKWLTKPARSILANVTVNLVWCEMSDVIGALIIFKISKDSSTRVILAKIDIYLVWAVSPKFRRPKVIFMLTYFNAISAPDELFVIIHMKTSKKKAENWIFTTFRTEINLKGRNYPGGLLSQKSYVDVPAGPRKIWLSLYQFVALFHQYTIFERKASNFEHIGCLTDTEVAEVGGGRGS